MAFKIYIAVFNISFTNSSSKVYLLKQAQIAQFKVDIKADQLVNY